ncbi:LamG-like jellyroll fold domain-containing protein [Kitasatospora sp. NPDC057015]|uniref:LamG-like jellyroll fold domain-containing protein n=1 Tax=Kitasatospora sp. NPDC057015 TaxID=3346001 RepID=UPI0036349B9B
MSDGTEPDWAELADRHEAALRRRRRLRAGGIVLGGCLLAAGAGLLAVGGPGHRPGVEAAPERPGPGPAEESPALLADRSGRASVALAPAARVEEVPDGHVLRLTGGPDSYGSSVDRVVDVGRSFTLTAWVYNDAPSGSRAVISEGDGPYSSFELGRAEPNGRPAWSFRVRTAGPAAGGADGGDTVQVVADGAGTVAVWVLLTATYDAERSTIALYLDGVPAAAAAVPGIRPAEGPLQFGRSRQPDGWGGHWSGAVGRVRVWDRALDAAGVAALSAGAPGAAGARPIGSWLVD